MRVIAGALIFSLFLAGMNGPVESREIRKDYHESFEVSRGFGLRLRQGDGDVFIKKWDKDIIDVKIEYSAEYKSIGSGDRDFKVNFRKKDKIIEISGVEKSTPIIGFHIFNIKEYTYTIYAPDYLTLDIDGDDGEVYIDDWRENIELHIDDGTAVLSGIECENTTIRIEDGDLEIEDHKGNIDIDCDDGNIDIFRSTIPDCRIRGMDGLLNIGDTRGDFDIELDDGDADIYRLLSKKLYYQSSDGDVDIELLKTDELDLDIRTDDGDIKLLLEEGISVTFTIDVDDGRIKIDLPSGVITQKDDHWMSGKLRDGKGRVRIRTEDGDVTLKEIR
ncbi:MAG: DUF4097 family beta strand repeat protein [Candidatus Krumholzibacteriota bacterium]|nr:DUF4097 family beta strand repeat protein [Candidatus Krumholzibacteriota bacterium]